MYSNFAPQHLGKFRFRQNLFAAQVTDKSYMRTVTSVWPEWVLSAQPDYFVGPEAPQWPASVQAAFQLRWPNFQFITPDRELTDVC